MHTFFIFIQGRIVLIPIEKKLSRKEDRQKTTSVKTMGIEFEDLKCKWFKHAMLREEKSPWYASTFLWTKLAK